MNILLVSRGYPDSHDPLWGIFEIAQARALRRLGHNVAVLVVDGRTRFYPRKIGVRHIKEDDVFIYHLFPFSLISFSQRLVTRLNQWMLRRLVRKISRIKPKPDIIYAHYLNNMENSLPLKDELKVPLVGIEHWSEMMKEDLNKEVSAQAQRVYSKVDRLIAVSPILGEAISKKFGVETIYIPNMVEDAFVLAERNKSNLHGFKFCSVGRLVRFKNFDILIKSMKILIERKFEIKLTIIGDGPEYNRLNSLIKELNMQKYVQLKGMKSKEEIINELNDSDCFVLASRQDTFGVVLIEAMAMGLPVIACNIGGPKNIVESSNGLLVNPNDPIALADAMEYMIDNIDNYDSEKIAKECVEKYSSSTVAKKLETVFIEVISENKQAV